MDWKRFIVRRPDVLSGKPTFVGTRIAVESVLERLGDGWSEDDLLAQHPQLAREHFKAAMAYAAAALSSDELVVLDAIA